MPYKSDLQRKFFNFKAKSDPKFAKMAKEYNDASKGMDLPEKADKKDSKCPHCGQEMK